MNDLTDSILCSNSIRHCLEIIQEHFGFKYSTFHLMNNARSKADNPFVRTTYPDAWVSYYLLNNFVRDDPVILRAAMSPTPFNWAEIEPEPRSIPVMQKSAEFGIGQSGFSCPYTDLIGRMSILSVNSTAEPDAWAAFLAQNRETLMSVSQDLHIKALSEAYADGIEPPLLSPREFECLRWTAEGKTYSEIAIILDLSEHTVRSYLKVARLKLNSVSLAQTIAKASKLGLF